MNECINENKNYKDLVELNLNKSQEGDKEIKVFSKRKTDRKLKILSNKEKKEISLKGNTLDIPATILDYLNGNTKMGLGVSLLEDDKKVMKSLSNNNQDISKAEIIKNISDRPILMNDIINFLNNNPEIRYYNQNQK